MDTLRVIRDGIVVGELPEKDAAKCRKLMREYLGNIPEKKVQRAPGNAGDYGAGSFGAINYSSAYHNPAATKTDATIMRVVGPTVQAVAREMGLEYYEMVPDRMLYRTKKQPRESFHTDNTAGAESKNEVFFVVIVNLNETRDREFVCVPGTHSMSTRLKGGDFTPETDQAEWKAREVTYKIPPGGYALVVENIVHRIAGGKNQVTMGKFCAFRISNSPRQWCPENDARMESQAALAHKGGQIAPMVPKLWVTNWPDKCEALAATLRPEMNTTHTYKSGVKKGRTITMPKREPPSLQDLGRMYPMSHEARTRFRPQLVGPGPPAKRQRTDDL